MFMAHVGRSLRRRAASLPSPLAGSVRRRVRDDLAPEAQRAAGARQATARHADRRARDHVQSDRHGQLRHDDLVVHGEHSPRLPNTSLLAIPRTSAVLLLDTLTGVAAAAGSACDAGKPHVSETLRAMGVAPGDLIRIETRRGAIEIMARADRAIAEDMVFVPFAYVEAAANVLTNPQLDPYGKIPEFKFSACRVTRAEGAIAAE